MNDGVQKTGRGGTVNFLATDDVPDRLFGILVVSRPEQYTEADLRFFRDHPEAGGYYDMGSSQPVDDGSEEGAPVQDDVPVEKADDKWTWSLAGAMKKMWERDQAARDAGGRGRYSYELALVPENAWGASYQPNSWKCNAGIADAFNYDGNLRWPTGLYNGAPPRAEWVYKGDKYSVPEFLELQTEWSAADENDIITVNEGPGSAMHMAVVGPDPRGSGERGVYHVTGGVDASFNPEKGNGGVIWTPMQEFMDMYKDYPELPEGVERFHLSRINKDKLDAMMRLPVKDRWPKHYKKKGNNVKRRGQR